ncbi:MAG TPA: tail fiber domain-containing protein [Candidatus Elarobacter sp.]|nr:tail fiber domain-containing protein [Candidatus Elarobacter sp.]
MTLLCSIACAAVTAGCADGSSSTTHAPSVVPLGTQQSPVAGESAAHSGVRRPMSVVGCTGSGTYSFVGGAAANVAAGGNAVVGGGYDNDACDGWSGILSGYENTINGSGNGDGFIGAGQNNVLTSADTNAAIVAGKSNSVTDEESAIVAGASNSVAAAYALVGSGESNAISYTAQFGTIVSGYQNHLSGEYGLVGAGLDNTVSGEGAYVAAGGYNTASGEGAVVDGGFNSTAAGAFATVPGGYVNSAAGTYSFAAGARAKAAQTGTFVWSDGSDGDTILTSSRAYQFLARASGGFTLYTNTGSTVGAQLAAGSGTWASLSDRNAKTNIAPLDDAAVLDKVAALPVSRWSYKSEHGVRHVGPMAQDFYAAFNVGEDDKHITSIDEDGVALAAIKALHGENLSLRTENARLRADLARYRSSTDARLASLTAAVKALQVR